MLLHMILPPFAIDAARYANAHGWQFRRRLQVVEHPAIFRIRNFRNP
jgi:hypothetical protein